MIEARRYIREISSPDIYTQAITMNTYKCTIF